MLVIEPFASLDEVRALFTEYAHSLGVDLSFQNFDEELASLPGDYDPILIARSGGELAGCIALHPFAEGIGEIKRLYVRPSFRKDGVGRALVLQILDIAREKYHAVRLDTLPTMTAAMRLYESLGFTDIEPYRFNPIPGTRFLQLTF